MYRASDFDYSLPPELIAQERLPAGAASRLLVVDRGSGDMRHLRFAELLALVAPGDVLVLNVSRVIRARLRGTRDGGAAAELLLVRELPDGTWLALGHPGGKLKPGRRVRFGADSAAEIVAVLGGGLPRGRVGGALAGPGPRPPHRGGPPPAPIPQRPPAPDRGPPPSGVAGGARTRPAP